MKCSGKWNKLEKVILLGNPDPEKMLHVLSHLQFLAPSLQMSTYPGAIVETEKVKRDCGGRKGALEQDTGPVKQEKGGKIGVWEQYREEKGRKNK